MLAPGLYHLVQSLGTQAKWIKELSLQPFHRYVSRCLMLFAVFGLWPLLGALGARSWKSVGIISPRDRINEILLGLLLGLGSLALVAVLALVAGARHIMPLLTLEKLLELSLQAGLSAIAVSVLEELLFRGVLYGRLRSILGHPVSLVLSSALYALVHFFERPPSPASVSWFSGFETLGQMLEGITQWATLFPTFFTLTLVGVILGQMYDRTGSLFAPIALHAGWIFWLKLYSAVTVVHPAGPVRIFGSGKLIDGWTALAVMGLCAWLSTSWQPKKRGDSQ